MDLEALLGDDAEDLLTHESTGIPKTDLELPGPDFIDRVTAQTDRSPQVLRNLQSLYDHGTLAGTGYVSILPVDQGIEHSAAASFAPNPAYFDPKNIVELAIEGGCNAVASTFGALGAVSRRYAHRIPFIVKVNHNELLTYPVTYDQVMFGSVRKAFDLGAAGVGATIYFGSDQSMRQLREVSEAFELAHQLGKGREQVVKLAVENVRRARHVTPDVEFSPMDATRADWDFLSELVTAAVEAGATTINVPDTVGCARPTSIATLFRHLRATVPGIEGVT
jgi:hypothetical protein